MPQRGDIFYICKTPTNIGSEQEAGRPAVVVSNNMTNAHSQVLEVVYLTASPKTDLPTHCTIRSTGIASTVLCEQVSSVSWERFGRYIAKCTDDEMKRIDQCLLISLGIDIEHASEVEYADDEEVDEVEEADDYYEDYIEAKAKAEVLEQQYEKLLQTILSGGR